MKKSYCSSVYSLLSTKVSKRTANRRFQAVFRVLLFGIWTSFLPSAAPDQCKEELNVKGMALKGFVFKKFLSRGAHLCAARCDKEVTCQSFNYATETKTCELNNRTKEARPQNFEVDPDRFYIRRLNNRGSWYIYFYLFDLSLSPLKIVCHDF